MRPLTTRPPVPEQGAVLPPLVKGPYTSAHIVRWCAAQQNWDRIHYDLSYAQQHAGLRERVINGALKQHLLVQCLDNAYGGEPWIRRLNFRFAGPDFVGESLEVRGVVRSVLPGGAGARVVVDLSIHNLQQDRATTTGWAVLDWPAPDGAPGPLAALPAEFALDETTETPGATVPPEMARLVGTQAESIESAYPLDLSRLRLFADAVGGLRALHYDLKSGLDSRHASVVAPPLFPIHALEARPDTLPLSEAPDALGREAVNEIGRNLARRFGFPASGMVNGGADIELHSLMRVGETASARSVLLSAAVKQGAQGGAMLLSAALNTYRTTTGRLLLKERQTTVYRNFQSP